jgi:hypothetical protein
VRRDAGEARRPSGGGRGGGRPAVGESRGAAEAIDDVREKEAPGRGNSPGSKRNGPPAKEDEEGAQAVRQPVGQGCDVAVGGAAIACLSVGLWTGKGPFFLPGPAACSATVTVL